jgi:hypothetical protein
VSKNNLPLKDLKKRFLDELATHLGAIGFVKNGQQYERTIGEITQVIHIMFIDDRRSASTAVVVNLAVRHSRIEELANSWRDDLSPKDKAATATLGIELGRLLGQGQMRRLVSSSHECVKVGNEVADLVCRHAEPYFNIYSDLKNVQDLWLSQKPQVWQQLPGGRAIRLPLILLVRGEVDAGRREFKNQYEYLKSSGDPLAEDYRRFVEKACVLLGVRQPELE